MEKRARRKFTAEYKAEVVRLVRDGGKTIGEVNLPRFGGHLG
jgi:transposase-like protein